MTAQFLLHNLQRVTVTNDKEVITFETERVNGCTYYFTLSKEEFFAFHDVTILLSHDNMRGHFPLSDRIWFHYSRPGASFYDTAEHGQPYFKFENFHQYLSHAHRKLLSFLRLRPKNSAAAVNREDGDKTFWQREREAFYDRADRGKRRGGQKIADKSSGGKRPLSVVVQSRNKSTATKASPPARRKTLPRSTDDVIVPDPGEACAVFPKRINTSTGRWADSSSPPSNLSSCLSSPEAIKLDENNSSISMDC